MRRFIVVAVVAILGMTGGLVQAETVFTNFYPFEIFTSNGDWGVGGPNEDDPLLDLFLEVHNGFETASFVFHNQSDVSLSNVAITEVFFDDGTLLGISNVINGPGVFFDPVATPSNLPGGNLLDPPFVTTQQFSADPAPPGPFNGVNAGEFLQIDFALLPGGTIQDVFDELADGTLRVGIRVQAFSDGSSESAVQVPEPTSALLLALGGLGLLGRRR